MKKLIAVVALRLVVGCLASSSALADEVRPTEAVINNCVSITMSVKGCGEDRLSPCEDSFCYQTYDFALMELAPTPVSDSSAPASSEKRDRSAKRKKHHRQSA